LQNLGKARVWHADTTTILFQAMHVPIMLFIIHKRNKINTHINACL
jgi:hypothetical protein